MHGQRRVRSKYTVLRPVLSKGLEYRTAIVDATSITDPRDFYVAISRCTNSLYIVTDNPVLHCAPVIRSTP